MLRPDHVENLSKHSRAYLMLFLDFIGSFRKSFRNKVKSSAYVSFSFLFPFRVSYGVIFEFLRVRARISMHKTKR